MSEVRSSKRSYFLNLLSSSGNTIISILTQVIMVPIGVYYLGTEELGLWFLINSVVSYFGALNLGIHSAALYQIMSHGRCKSAGKITRISFFLLFKIIIAVLVIILSLSFFGIDFTAYIFDFKSNSGIIYQASVMFLILVSGILINIPMLSLSAYLGGTQNQHTDNLFNSLTILLNFCAFSFGAFMGFSLIQLSLIFVCSTMIANLIKLLYVWNESKKLTDIECIHDSIPDERLLLKDGSAFFVMGINALLLWNSDQTIISRVLSLEDVTSYSLTMKLYLVNISILTILNGSLYPLLGKYINENNWLWVRNQLARISSLTFIISGYIFIGGVFLLEPIFYFWTDLKGYPGLEVAFFLGIYMVLYPFINVNVAILSILRKLRFVPLVMFLEALTKILLSYVFVVELQSISGAVLGTIVATLLWSFIILPLMVKYRSNGEINILGLKKFFNLVIVFLFGCFSFYLADNYRDFMLRITFVIVILPLFSVVFYFLNKKSLDLGFILKIIKK